MTDIKRIVEAMEEVMREHYEIRVPAPDCLEDMARAALRASRRLDRGRAVVPVKPTVAMKMAGAAAITEDHMAKMANYDAAIDCWAAMLNEWLDGGHDDD